MFMDIDDKNNRLIQEYNQVTGHNIKVLRSHVHDNTNEHLHDEHEHVATEELES